MSTASKPRTVSREEWLDARRAFLAREKESTSSATPSPPPAARSRA